MNVICMKWGTLYGPDYVNILHRMVKRNLTRPHRFVCFTDDATGLEAGIETFPLPPANVPHKPETAEWRKKSPWRKVSLFAPKLGDLEGPALFLDLDIIVTGSLDPFFEHPGELCMIENWTTPGIGVGNSSVFRFTVGAHSQVFEKYNADPDALANTLDNEQIYVSKELASKLVYWPETWVKSWKLHCLPKNKVSRLFETPVLPEGARIIAFPGSPNPPEAAQNWLYGKHWWKPKFAHPAPWVLEYWK